MTERLYTGFHAVEEKIRSVENSTAVNSSSKSITSSMKIFYSKPGPRIKKILELAKRLSIPCNSCEPEKLDSMVKVLPELARDHRGIVLCVSGETAQASNIIDFEQWVASVDTANHSADKITQNSETSGKNRKTVIVLDSVTDPHNVGAIIRSADQFGVELVVIPEHRGQSNVSENEIIARSSAGSSAWVPVSIVKNLVRSVKLLKDAGFWVYGADAGGESVQNLKFAENTVLIMGSEGTGIARLLKEQCDTIVSIPTCGKIDSLNVSVAAGVLLYEIHRQSL